jgi:glycogen debranching enzyme
MNFQDFEYEPIENPDWGFARNVRAALLSPSAEWVQSVCSFPFEVNGKTFIAPNRDYPYEGLVAYHAGENWKFIDCIGLSLRRQNGAQIPLTASKVKVNPWRVEYQYTYEGGTPILVSYYLDSQNSPELLTGSVEFSFPCGLAYNGELLIPSIQPFIDIRHMYGGSAFTNYRISNDFKNRSLLQISNDHRILSLFAPECELTTFHEPEVLNWQYKLGTGSRTENATHETVFTDERKNIGAFFSLQLPTSAEEKSVKISLSTSLDTTGTKFFLPDIKLNASESARKDEGDAQQIVETFPLSQDVNLRAEIWSRIVALTKFKTYIYSAEAQKYVRVPHAGAWWFKTPWYRDLFEGLLNSFETLMRIPQESYDIREIILSAFSFQDKQSGLIVNKIPEFTTLPAQYNSCDATLLCFIVANAYFHKTKDAEFGWKVLDCIATAISSFKANFSCDADGPPRIDASTGLLLCAPHHSWIDTRTRRLKHDGRTFEGLPNRLSIAFLKNLCEQKLDLEVIASSPRFFLPEINAQWIMMLAGFIQTIDLLSPDPPSADLAGLKATTQIFLTKARKVFKSIFWNENKGYLFNAVLEDGITGDYVACEAAVTAAALLGETVFTPGDLRSIWNCAERELLAHRRLVKYGDELLPFGILTKNEGQKVFYGDDQYHSDMIWPRSTPYLIKLLRMLNEDDTARDILINNLDHQMSECAIFYNQELFSPAFGNNAHPNGTTSQNPVPVKNPIQFWSQWCDAYLEVFGGKE